MQDTPTDHNKAYFGHFPLNDLDFIGGGGLRRPDDGLVTPGLSVLVDVLAAPQRHFLTKAGL